MHNETPTVSVVKNTVGLSRGKANSHVCSQGSYSETVSISNLGVAKTGPMVEDSGSLLLEYVNGSACTTSDQRRTTYTTRIHLVCSTGSLVSGAGQRRGLVWSGSSISAWDAGSACFYFRSECAADSGRPGPRQWCFCTCPPPGYAQALRAGLGCTLQGVPLDVSFLSEPHRRRPACEFL